MYNSHVRHGYVYYMYIIRKLRAIAYNINIRIILVFTRIKKTWELNKLVWVHRGITLIRNLMQGKILRD